MDPQIGVRVNDVNMDRCLYKQIGATGGGVGIVYYLEALYFTGTVGR